MGSLSHFLALFYLPATAKAPRGSVMNLPTICEIIVLYSYSLKPTPMLY